MRTLVESCDGPFLLVGEKTFHIFLVSFSFLITLFFGLEIFLKVFVLSVALWPFAVFNLACCLYFIILSYLFDSSNGVEFEVWAHSCNFSSGDFSQVFFDVPFARSVRVFIVT